MRWRDFQHPLDPKLTMSPSTHQYKAQTHQTHTMGLKSALSPNLP